MGHKGFDNDIQRSETGKLTRSLQVHDCDVMIGHHAF